MKSLLSVLLAFVLAVPALADIPDSSVLRAERDKKISTDIEQEYHHVLLKIENQLNINYNADVSLIYDENEVRIENELISKGYTVEVHKYGDGAGIWYELIISL